MVDLLFFSNFVSDVYSDKINENVKKVFNVSKILVFLRIYEDVKPIRKLFRILDLSLQ